MVDEERVAVLHLPGLVEPQQALHTRRERAQVQGQHGELGQHPTLRVEDRAAGITRLADDRGVAGAEQRVLHLLDDPGQALAHDLDRHGIDGVADGAHDMLAFSMMRLPMPSTVTTCSGHTTVVESYWSTKAGPAKR